MNLEKRPKQKWNVELILGIKMLANSDQPKFPIVKWIL